MRAYSGKLARRNEGGKTLLAIRMIERYPEAMKQMKRMLVLGFSLLLLMAPAANAYVSATPSYYDFGSVPSGQFRTVTITFMNQSNTPIPNFNTHCSGDFSAFSCSSSCYSLRAYGSCTVQVQFMPRNGDGLRRTFWVNGSGGGSSASSTVSGTDARSD